jgi:RIO kinase 2
MAQHEFVPTVEIIHYSGLVDDEVKHWIDELDLKDLLWGTSGARGGYILNYNGYDLLALNALVRGNVIEALGMPIGMGKEADVFEALTPKDEKVAIKFHRLGRISFRRTRQKREFIGKKRQLSWLYQSRLAAEREYAALTAARDVGVPVPVPINQNRHTVVMGYIEGHQLSETVLDEPVVFFDEILGYVAKGYAAGFVHNDLSEFNILVNDDGSVYFIDWPQYVERGARNYEEAFEKDVTNILRYFERRYRIKRDLEGTLRTMRAALKTF